MAKRVPDPIRRSLRDPATIRVALFVALGTYGGPSRAWALVPGGGPARSDCYAEWQITTPEVTATRGRTGVDCQDGDPACDVDGRRDGTCTFGVSICALQGNVPTCTPQEVTAVNLSRRARRLGVQLPPLPASASTCGPATLIPLALRSSRRGPRPSRSLTLGLTARSVGRPRTDRDLLSLRCVPNRGAAQCPANSSGGPRELSMAVAPEGSDLDNGWTGTSHNFPVVFGTSLRMCLVGCDTVNDPACLEDEAPTDQVNGQTFGPPLPLFAAGLPVCLVNRLATPKVTAGAADLRTGAISLEMHLLSDVFLTSPSEVCPRCSGADVGTTGVCQGGPRQGQACRTDGAITVAAAVGNGRFTVSSDCLPAGSPQATLTINLPLTTATSVLPGPRPCGASQDDSCGAGTCSAACTGQACVTRTAAGECVDVKGGVSQVCCSSDSATSCFPTATDGQIVRAGQAGAPAPAFPDSTYPKTATGVLAATFCEPATGSPSVDVLTGLPGPGALVFPVTEQWIK